MEPLAPPTEPPRPPRGYRKSALHPLSFALALALLAALCIWPPPTPNEGGLLAAILGRWIGGLVIASLLGLLAWWLTRRSHRAANLIFCVVLSLNLTAAVIGGIRHAQVQAFGAYKKASTTVLEDLRQRGYQNATAEDRERLLAAAEEGARTLYGRDAIVAAATADAIRSFQSEADEYQRRLTALSRAGGFSIAGLKSPPDADGRLALIGALREASIALEAKTRDMGAAFASGLESRGIEPKLAAGVRRTFESGGELELLLQVRSLDREINDAGTQLITLLRDNWSSWEPDSSGKRPVFRDDKSALFEQFRRYANALQNASEQQQALIDRLNRPQ
ncbi:MAG: hypothetical protein WD749_11820 [Phycisphaerales bacterium]